MIKILVLHGKQQNAEVIRTRLGRLPSKLKKEVVFRYIDAPHLLPLCEGDDVQMRTWWDRDSGGKMMVETLEHSLAILQKIWTDEGPFSGAFGFSMGGTLSAILAAIPQRFPELMFVCVAGAPDIPVEGWDYINDHYDEYEGATAALLKLPSLHIIGLADRVVDRASSHSLRNRFDPRLSIVVEHDQGHCIPMKSGHLNQYASFIKDMHTRIQNRCSIPNNNLQADEFVCSSDMVATAQTEEWEVLSSIYPNEIKLASECLPSKAGDPCAKFHVTLMSLLPSCDTGSSPPDQWQDNIGLTFKLTDSYPFTTDPLIEISTGKLTLMDGFTDVKQRNLLNTVLKEAAIRSDTVDESCGIGDPRVMVCIQAALDWFSDGKWEDDSPDTSVNIASKENIEEGMDILNDSASADIDMQMVRDATEKAYKISSLLASSGENLDYELNDNIFRLNKYELANLLPESARGVWNYTVGLVGKPSAGKSTFYNAVTHAALHKNARRMAAVAPHPFTTIEPNIGPGWFASFDNDLQLPATTSADNLRTERTKLLGANSENQNLPRHPLHGYALLNTSVCGSNNQSSHHMELRRLLPVCVKDVAGLVPGAYKGRGKGNRFLADLCDADVLVHVIDITGKADRDGNVIGVGNTGCSDPLQDAEWIREELHCWIYGNVRAKWGSVIRHQKSEKTMDGSSKCRERVISLFSGYQGPRWCIEAAAKRGKLKLEEAFLWGDAEIHQLVAHFLSVRFPICLALNKVDELIVAGQSCQTSGTKKEDIVEICRRIAKERGEVAVPMSARAECWSLLKQKQVPPPENSKVIEEEQALEAVMQRYGSTGVLEAISAAVTLKPPVLCYPVCDLESEYPIGWTPGKRIVHSTDSHHDTTQGPRLQDCIQLKPGSTVGDVFSSLKRNTLAHARLAGELVRADGRSLQKSARPYQLSRNSVIDRTNCVLRIQTNRKSVWQADQPHKLSST